MTKNIKRDHHNVVIDDLPAKEALNLLTDIVAGFEDEGWSVTVKVPYEGSRIKLLLEREETDEEIRDHDYKKYLELKDKFEGGKV